MKNNAILTMLLSPFKKCPLILICLLSTNIMAIANSSSTVSSHHHFIAKDDNKKDIDWNFFYMGANGGWGFSSITNSETPFGSSAIADILPQSGKNNLDGSLFGAQLGVNKTIKNWVLGIEWDIDGTGIGGTEQLVFQSIQASINPIQPNPNSTNGFMVQNNVDWLTSIRGRIGTTWRSSMLYFTAGGAWERMSSKLLINGGVADSGWDIAQPGSFSNTKGGFVLGAGVESIIARHWTVRGEYLYYDFSSTNNNQLAFLNCGVPGCGVNTSNSGNSINALRLGVNYRI